jgi:cyclopropane fatty-acyl-phospholipid synthase-like methyltransferase
VLDIQHGRILPEVVESFTSLESVKSQRILDYACGRGDVISSCLKYLHHDQEIYGLDFSEESVDFVNDRFAKSSAFRGAVCLKDSSCGFEENHFDLALATEIVEHLNDNDLSKMPTEVRKLLSDSGLVFITAPNDEDFDTKR